MEKFYQRSGSGFTGNFNGNNSNTSQQKNQVDNNVIFDKSKIINLIMKEQQVETKVEVSKPTITNFTTSNLPTYSQNIPAPFMIPQNQPVGAFMFPPQAAYMYPQYIINPITTTTTTTAATTNEVLSKPITTTTTSDITTTTTSITTPITSTEQQS